MKTIGFFSSRSGIGKTTLIFHLAWMYQELGIRTVVIDLDPQANLTTMLLGEDQVLDLISNEENTVYGMVKDGQIRDPVFQEIGDYLTFLPGDPTLGIFEELLSGAWILQDEETERARAKQITTSFYRLARRAAEMRKAQLVLIDVGPGLSAINRSAFIACDSVIIPLSLSAVQLWGIGTVGTLLRRWRSDWKDELAGMMENTGYVILQDALRDLSLNQSQGFATIYRLAILGKSPDSASVPPPDPYHLATLKRYPSLMSLAQDAHKPMFLLKPADGAIGSHVEAVKDCYRDFKQLALRIASACGVAIPS